MKIRINFKNFFHSIDWRDLENVESRFLGRQKILDDLFTAVRLSRPDDASEIPLETPALQRRNPKKKTTIKQLFSAASKFQKNLRRYISYTLDERLKFTVFFFITYFLLYIQRHLSSMYTVS